MGSALSADGWRLARTGAVCGARCGYVKPREREKNSGIWRIARGTLARTGDRSLYWRETLDGAALRRVHTIIPWETGNYAA